MKRRITWPLTLLLVLVLALVFPAIAYTAEAVDAPPQKFTASGAVYISGPYQSEQKWPHQYAEDEPVDTLPGTVISSSWEAVNGGSLTTLHDGKIVLNLRGTFRGVLEGTFAIAASDGSVLSGTMRGSVSGTWNPQDPLNPAGTYIEDNGTWKSDGGTGAFVGIRGRGTWATRLDWNDVMGTYVGTISMSGSHSRDR